MVTIHISYSQSVGFPALSWIGDQSPPMLIMYIFMYDNSISSSLNGEGVILLKCRYHGFKKPFSFHRLI